MPGNLTLILTASTAEGCAIRLRSPALAVRRDLAHTFLEQGTEAGLEKLRQLRRSSPWLPGESLTNLLGYLLLAREQVAEAVEVFGLNVDSHPRSSNAYNSLAEAHLIAGEPDLAKECYERSIELDSRNLNSRWMLAQLIHPS